MSKLPRLQQLFAAIACIALVGAGTTLAIAADEASTSGNAAETQYGEGEGCTPGYWKNHTDSWVGYSPGDSFNDVFGVSYFDPSFTLLDALDLGGGGFNALARHAAAALLNGSNPDVGYDLSSTAVIELVQEAFATDDPEPTKDGLAALNESGCPIDAHGDVSG